MSKSNFQYAFLVFGISFSALLVMFFPNTYHKWDLEAFRIWANFWSENWHNYYINCDTCNYPIIGTLFSAGLFSVLGGEDFQRTVFTFRFILAGIDGINVLLVFWLLTMLSIENAPFWAGLIGLLPSSWAGAALWGQIDNVSQLFILIMLVWIVFNNVNVQYLVRRFLIYIGVSGVILSWVILTKQLTIFSGFAITILLVVNIYFYFREWSPFIKTCLLMAGITAFATVSWDLFLNLKPPYFSHLHYILSTGSGHIEYISGNGFNIWMFLNRDMWSSSRIPFVIGDSISPRLALTIVPQKAGIILFLSFIALLSLSLGLFLKKCFENGERFLNNEVLLNLIYYMALVNLGFNVLLTGTHERHLYHFYPFIILAFLGLRKFNAVFTKGILALILLGSVLYGIFVLRGMGFMPEYAYSMGNTPHRILSLYHLLLLFILTSIFIYHHEFTKYIFTFLLNMRKVKKGGILKD